MPPSTIRAIAESTVRRISFIFFIVPANFITEYKPFYDLLALSAGSFCLSEEFLSFFYSKNKCINVGLIVVYIKTGATDA